ncbi:hypothetical protein DFH06DRAFT_1469483 [Mycena polygramma]|nr:hypothetical protein DFH06DRAFT_1469483 [Mycena polygramma]
MAPAPPTSLPPLRRLAEYSVADINNALQGIRQLYWPPPPTLPPKLALPTRRDSGYASAVVSDDECDAEEALDGGDSDSSDSLDELRADPFERAFAIKWITGLICRIDELSSEDSATLLNDATAVLAHFSHQEDDDEFDLTRSFSFPSKGETVHIELNDAPLSTSDHTSVGLQSWGSAIILAERLCADLAHWTAEHRRRKAPARHNRRRDRTTTPPSSPTSPPTCERTSLPFPSTSPPSSSTGRRPPLGAPFDAPFDVVLAADVVYHPDHARWIRDCVARMLRRPGADAASDPGGIFHLIVPVRTSGRHEGMHRTVDEVFARSGEDLTGPDHCLAILGTTGIERQGSGIGRADEAGYRVFKIGWVS